VKRLKGTVLPPVVILALAAVAAHLARPAEVRSLDLDLIPPVLAGWRGQDTPLDSISVEVLQPDVSLMRRYDGPGGAPAWLCVVYHQNNKYGAHDVPVCYISQGYSKRDLGRARIRRPDGTEFEVNRLVAGKPRDTRLVYYWFAIGDRFFAKAGEFRRAQMISGLLRNRSEGALVRIETPVIGGDIEGAEARLQDLGRRLLVHLPAAFSGGGARGGAAPGPE
jgi:EpsI family protein